MHHNRSAAELMLSRPCRLRCCASAAYNPVRSQQTLQASTSQRCMPRCPSQQLARVNIPTYELQDPHHAPQPPGSTSGCDRLSICHQQGPWLDSAEWGKTGQLASRKVQHVEPPEVAELVVPGHRDGQVECCVGGIQDRDEDAPLQREPGEGVDGPVLVQVGGRRAAQHCVSLLFSSRSSGGYGCSNALKGQPLTLLACPQAAAPCRAPAGQQMPWPACAGPARS